MTHQHSPKQRWKQLGLGLLMSLSLSSVGLQASDSEPNYVTLGGDLGEAHQNNITRFLSKPFTNLAWLRADLSGEVATEFDSTRGHIMRRWFKNYSGDISGRFIEIMAMNGPNDSPTFKNFEKLLADVPRLQREEGYFCSRNNFDLFAKHGEHSLRRTVMPTIWGNTRLLCGLVEACRLYPENEELLSVTKKLGDFFINITPRFTDPKRMAEYTAGDTFSSSYTTCWFPTMESLVRLYRLTGEKKYLDSALVTAEFYKTLDVLPIDHSHGMLCSQISLLMLYEDTRDESLLQRVESRWSELVQKGYIHPSGGLPEGCHISERRDEGCSEADWLRFNLRLAKVTGKTKYWAMAERLLHNHYQQNQANDGSFGHRYLLHDANGVYGFDQFYIESTWCCTYHGQFGLLRLRDQILDQQSDHLKVNFAVDFTQKQGRGEIVSKVVHSTAKNEVMRQNIQLKGLPGKVLSIRLPHWAHSVSAVDSTGASITLSNINGYYRTKVPVQNAEFVFYGDVYAEDIYCQRLPNGPGADQAFVVGYGPKIHVIEGSVKRGKKLKRPPWPITIDSLKSEGLVPLSSAMRGKDCYFIFGREMAPLKPKKAKH